MEGKIAEKIDTPRKLEEINGILNEIHGDNAYVTLFDRHGNHEDICLDSDMFISLNAWLPGTKFIFEYYESQTKQKSTLTQELRILEHGEALFIPSPPNQSLKESLNKIDEYTRRKRNIQI
ncbi:hypothetical protein HYT26_00010 [Candidatus Pacearchaeota archaeon]|nr:hypothetical protein [Candidatus Pacearchaeota archaeon]